METYINIYKKAFKNDFVCRFVRGCLSLRRNYPLSVQELVCCLLVFLLLSHLPLFSACLSGLLFVRSDLSVAVFPPYAKFCTPRRECACCASAVRFPSVFLQSGAVTRGPLRLPHGRSSHRGNGTSVPFPVSSSG